MPSKAPATRFRFRSPDPDSVQKDYLKRRQMPAFFLAALRLQHASCTIQHANQNLPHPATTCCRSLPASDPSDSEETDVELRAPSFERQNRQQDAMVYCSSKLGTRHSLLESLPRQGSDRLQASYSLRSPSGPHCVRYSATLRSYSGFVPAFIRVDHHHSAPPPSAQLLTVNYSLLTALQLGHQSTLCLLLGQAISSRPSTTTMVE